MTRVALQFLILLLSASIAQADEQVSTRSGVSESLAAQISAARKYQEEWARETSSLTSRSTVSIPRRTESGSTVIEFYFRGTSLDDDLVNFFSFMIARDPALLKPTIVDRGHLLDSCGVSEFVCSTDGYAMLRYKQLVRYVPEDLAVRVTTPLTEATERHVQLPKGATAIPGLTFEPFDTILRVASFNSRYDEKTLCKRWRFDERDDCVLGKSGKDLILEAQGLRVLLQMDEEQGFELVADFIRSVSNTKGYQLGNVGVSVNGPPIVDMQVANSATSDSSCFSVSGVSHDELMERHSRHIGATTIPSRTGQAAGLYPVIEVFDYWRSGASFATMAETDFEWGKTSTPGSECFELRASQDGHAEFILSQYLGSDVVAGRSLIPALNKTSPRPVKVYNVKSASDLAELLNFQNKAARDPDDSNNRILSISIHFENQGTFFKTLKDSIEALPDNVLLVTSAGQQNRPGLAGVQLSSLSCDNLPACLGGLRNVITVAATDHGAISASLWPVSNHGSEIVSLAAPGSYIVAREPMRKGVADPAYLTYGVRHGTSFSVPFVVAAAAELWREYPKLTAYQIRQKLISASRPIEQNMMIANRVQQRPVAGGLVDVKLARDSVSQSVVILEDGSRKVGVVRANTQQVPHGFQLSTSRVAMATDDASQCSRMRNILSIVRSSTDSNFFEVTCENFDRTIRKIFGYLKVRGGMACGFKGNCFLLIDPNGSTESIDLTKIRSIYFGVL